GEVAVEEIQLGVDARRGALDSAEPADDRDRDRLAGDREIADRLGGLAAPELLTFLHAHCGCPFTSLLRSCNQSYSLAAGGRTTALARGPAPRDALTRRRR